MAKYTEEQLNTCSKEMLITLLLSMQDQMEQLNKNFEKLVEQLATANNQRYGRSSEKLSVIDGQLSMDDLIFNEAEVLWSSFFVTLVAKKISDCFLEAIRAFRFCKGCFAPLARLCP